MRLLRYDSDGNFSLTEDLIKNIPSYAILSHTWRAATEEVTFKDFTEDFIDDTGKSKASYGKLQFWEEQANRNGLQHSLGGYMLHLGMSRSLIRPAR
jgi:hypothetical protein